MKKGDLALNLELIKPKGYLNLSSSDPKKSNEKLALRGALACPIHNSINNSLSDARDTHSSPFEN